MSQLKLNLQQHVNWLLVLIVCFGLLLRLYGLTNSVTDWHSFRQADTASVTKEYVKRGIDLLHPRFHDYGNVASGKDNPEGYRMVEFPFINAGVALVLRTIPGLDLVVTSRLASILFSLGTIISLYFLGKRWANESVGYLSALTYAALPYVVYYSRVILPEPFFAFFLTFSFLSFDLWLENKKFGWYVGALVSYALALLLKPFALFFAPVLAYLALRHFKYKVFFQPLLYVFGVSLLPLVWWRHWITQYPEGIPVTDWLFNSIDGKPIRFKPAWFRWLAWERYTKLILGGGTAVAALFSIGTKNKARELILVWGSCVFIYLATIAAGNVRHDYYQSITIPLFSLAVGQGLWVISQLKDNKKLLAIWAVIVALITLITKFPEPGTIEQFVPSWILIAVWAGLGGWILYAVIRKVSFKFLGAAVATGLFITSLIIGHWFVHGYYSTRPDYEEAGAAVDRLVPADAKIIAPAFADTLFLFQTNRAGWALGGEIDDKIAQGATYYVSTAYDDEAKELEQKYQVIEKTKNHIIIKLSR
jgi:4-amino-4-deoxy-L-arabinose transferase-like glycosyltransferase